MSRKPLRSKKPTQSRAQSNHVHPSEDTIVAQAHPLYGSEAATAMAYCGMDAPILRMYGTQRGNECLAGHDPLDHIHFVLTIEADSTSPLALSLLANQIDIIFAEVVFHDQCISQADLIQAFWPLNIFSA
jgi:hypothetical protein